MDIEMTISVPALDSEKASMYETRLPEVRVENTQNAQAADIPLGVYTDLDWDAESAHSVLEDATSWGTKTLPGAGPFYFANFESGEPILDHL